MICSVLIPSRFRPKQLRKTICSVLETSAGEDFEMIVYVNDDDDETVRAVEPLVDDDNPRIRLIVSRRKANYWDVDDYFNEMAEVANGDWIWQMNDDATVTGEAWDTKLSQIPLSGFIVQPEVYQLNNSVYVNPVNSPFPFFPRNCWKQFGLPKIPIPADHGLPDFLREKHGWKTSHLKGISVFHDRKVDKTLPKERL